jgi:hypothetical protein
MNLNEMPEKERYGFAMELTGTILTENFHKVNYETCHFDI